MKRKTCPVCNSRRLLINGKLTKCKKCGYVNQGVRT